MADKGLDAFNFIRSEALLSGLAIPKNIATALGTPATAAIEGIGRSRLAPLKEALRLPTNIKEFVKGATTDRIDIGTAGQRRARGPFSRVISGIDRQAMESLRRAGVPSKDIDRLLLRLPTEEVLGPNLSNILKTRPGRSLVLFQRTPGNIFASGIEEIAGAVTPGRANRFTGRLPSRGSRNLTRAAPIAGFAASELLEGTQLDPLILGLIANATGVRQLAFLLGVAASRGAGRAGESIAPFPEFSFDPQRLANPRKNISALRLLERVQGREP